MPDLLSAIRGGLWDDWWELLKFTIFTLVCASLVLSEKPFIEKYLGSSILKQNSRADGVKCGGFTKRPCKLDAHLGSSSLPRCTAL